MISTNITRVNNGSLSLSNIYHGAFSVVVACLTVVSVAFSFIILITIRQGKPSNFFKWKVVERFTVYTTVCDLLFYAVQIVYDIHLAINDGFSLSSIACTIYGVFTYEFAMSQVLLTVVTAIFAFVLIYRNRHLPLGRYDAMLHLPVFGIPLVVLVVGAALGQMQPNVTL